MITQIPVSSLLSKYIHDAAVFNFPTAVSLKRTIIPDGRATLVINLNDSEGSLGGFAPPMKKYDSLVMGSQTRPVVYTLNPSARFIYIRFYPYGFNTLFGIHGHELLNRTVELKELTGYRTSVLVNALYRGQSDAERIKQVLYWLEQKAMQVSLPHELVLNVCQSIQKKEGCIQLADFCGGSYNTYKQLQRHFEVATGLNAKLYARMIRFEAIIEWMRNHPNSDWFDLVARFELFDQSHLIKEFKFFSEYTPTGFRAKGLEQFV